MKKLLAILFILATFPTKSMKTEEQAVCVLLAGAVAYNIYRICNPTLEDFKREKEQREASYKAAIEMGKKDLEYENYKRRCLEAGKMLDK
jgi:hypothetical protein